MTEGRNDGRTEGRNRVTLYAPAITWRGHKNTVTGPEKAINTDNSFNGSFPDLYLDKVSFQKVSFKSQSLKLHVSI
jgi:hypothetical protein